MESQRPFRYSILDDDDDKRFLKKRKKIFVLKIDLFKHRELMIALELIEEKYMAAIFQRGEGEKKTFNVVINHRWNGIFLGRLVALHFRDLATTHPGILLLFPLGPRGGFHIVTIH